MPFCRNESRPFGPCPLRSCEKRRLAEGRRIIGQEGMIMKKKRRGREMEQTC